MSCPIRLHITFLVVFTYFNLGQISLTYGGVSQIMMRTNNNTKNKFKHSSEDVPIKNFVYIVYTKNKTILLQLDALPNTELLNQRTEYVNLLKTSKIDLRINGESVEHRLPPLLEHILQRIQAFFSVYKYTDTSQPTKESNEETIEPIEEFNYMSGAFQPSNSSNYNVLAESTSVSLVQHITKEEEPEFINISETFTTFNPIG